MITIKRDSGLSDNLRAYKVVLDEITIGDIGDGQVASFEVPKGSHALYLKVDWCRSNVVNFDVDGGVVEFECGSNLRGLKILLAFIYVSFLRDKYLWLKKVEKTEKEYVCDQCGAPAPLTDKVCRKCGTKLD